MVDFMLNNLRSLTSKGFDAGFEFVSLQLHSNRLIAFAFAGASEQGKTTFFCIIRSCFFDNLRIEHNHICSFIIKHNNPLADTDHIRRHANTTILMRYKRIEQVLCDLQIFFVADPDLTTRNMG